MPVQGCSAHAHTAHNNQNNNHDKCPQNIFLLFFLVSQLNFTLHHLSHLSHSPAQFLIFSLSINTHMHTRTLTLPHLHSLS